MPLKYFIKRHNLYSTPKRYLDDYSLVEVYDREGSKMGTWMVWGQFWRYFDDEVKEHLEEAGVQVVIDVPEVCDG